MFNFMIKPKAGPGCKLPGHNYRKYRQNNAKYHETLANIAKYRKISHILRSIPNKQISQNTAKYHEISL